MSETNYMETMEIKKLSIKTALPMVISMISIALYSIIDTIFISNTGNESLTTISLILPVIAIITAIGLGTAIGVNSILAKTLGEKNQEKIKKIIMHGIYLTFASYLLIALVAIVGIKPFFELFTDNEAIKIKGYSYLLIISLFSFGTLFEMLFEKILQAYGNTTASMITQFSGSVINLILDPILMFALGLGIKGAAIATVTGQITAMIIGCIFLIKNKIFTKESLKIIKVDFSILKDIYKVGFPTIIMEAAESFITLILNKILIGFSEEAVSVWGLYTQLQKFVMIIVYGLNYGMIPIVAYNWGAKHKQRVTDCFKFFIKLASGVTTIGMLVFLFVPNVIINFYSVSEATLQSGITAFRILSLGFIFTGISLVLSSLFQAFGKGTFSLIINLSRKIIFVLPLILILKNILGVNAIWISFTIAEVITTIIALMLYQNVKKNIIEKIEEK